MKTTINAKNQTLSEVHRLFGFQKQYTNSFTSLLSLEDITEHEQQEIIQIRDDFDDYISTDRVSEGLVKALTTFPLMRLAGFYRRQIKISLEQDIADISIEDEDTIIKGRFEILAVNRIKPIRSDTYFWVLVIESKNSGINALMGLSQLLTYAYQNLKYQDTIWGLTTNGMHYQFVNIVGGNNPTYQLMPLLNLMESDSSILLLQVLKAICKL
ncbi:restriction endonuclease subunit R [Microcoleus vaginatus]|uniref:restriction endonuclease subunit R n=1 Tax=Microcoleus vaginatus TaxID=119532 RepID=UPI00168251E0|nr:restriction endonuclease subunit R [Microcoleus sp. FACHB-84]MBD2012199.1 restriction endonuclease subunit R [Microcoleus sp. FACHB-45]